MLVSWKNAYTQSYSNRLFFLISANGVSHETGSPTAAPFSATTPAPRPQDNTGTGMEEIIHNDAIVPDLNMKTSGPVTGSPTDARPGDEKHLIMQIPRDPTSERPSLTVTLPDDPTSFHLTRVQMIKILGNFMQMLQAY
eukprot:GHVO01059418.1.p1 GENE.GHVO01059418.1~~GHVO01059418.1.p1  ORF type:complete len:139 (-),score=5.85 GHVO01059418.1:44-460(-)